MANEKQSDQKPANPSQAETMDHGPTVQAVWDDAVDRVRIFHADSRQFVRENPTKAVFTALGIGFVLGLIFRR